MMDPSPYLNFMHGRLSKFEDLFSEENVVGSLDFDFILSAANSIPLYKRLKIKPELFSESERENIESDADKAFRNYQEKLSAKRNASAFNACKVVVPPSETEYNLAGKRRETNLRSREETPPRANEKLEAENDETFLKYVYDPKGNNLLVPTLQKNVNFTIFPSSEKREPSKKSAPNFEVLEKLIQDICFGKYDHLARSRTSPVFSSSSSESEEEISSRVKNLSSQLKFTAGDNNKFSFLKNISDDSLKINPRETMDIEKTLVNYLTSDDESDQGDPRKKPAEPSRRNRRDASGYQKSGARNKPSARRKGKFANAPTAQSSNNVSTSECISEVDKASTACSLRYTSKSKVSFQETGDTKVCVLQKSLSDVSISELNEPQASGHASSQGKKYRKSKSNIKNRGLNHGKLLVSIPDEPDSPDECAAVQKPLPKSKSENFATSSASAFFGREANVINAVPTLSLDNSSSNRSFETKSQKQTSNEMKSTFSSQCKEANGGTHNRASDSSDSTDEDWENLAQRNLSVVDKLLQSSKH